MESPTRSDIAISAAVFLIAAVFVAGCSYKARVRDQVEVAQAERARELTQAARIANSAGRSHIATNNFARALVAYDLSDAFLRREQSIIGLPIRDQHSLVEDLLSENVRLKKEAVEWERDRERQEELWRTTLEAKQRELMLLGQEAERTRNQNIIRKFWGWFGITSTLAIVILTCIFVPGALLIFLRLVGWLVAKIPRIAGMVGVVSVKAVDQIYKAIETTKMQGESATIEDVRDNLSRSMDQDHKNLITARRRAVPIPITP